METKIKKIVDLINSQTVIIDIKNSYYGEGEVINVLEDDEGEPIGIIVQYEDDGVGYGNSEMVEEEITWEELFEQPFKLYTEHSTRTEVEL